MSFNFNKDWVDEFKHTEQSQPACTCSTPCPSHGRRGPLSIDTDQVIVLGSTCSTEVNTPTESSASFSRASTPTPKSADMENQRDEKKEVVPLCPPPAEMVVGISQIDLAKSTHVRLHATEIKSEGASPRIQIGTWGDTRLRTAQASWISIPTGSGMKSGSFYSTSVRPSSAPQLHVDRQIYFDHPFDEPPEVVPMLKLISSNHERNLRLRITITDVTSESFIAHLHTRDDSILYQSAISWLAIPKALKNRVLVGTVTEGYTKSHSADTITRRVQYPDDMFTTYRPTVHLFLTDLDFERGHDIIISTFPTNVTARGFDWNVSVGKQGNNTCCFGFGLTYVVM